MGHWGRLAGADTSKMEDHARRVASAGLWSLRWAVMRGWRHVWITREPHNSEVLRWLGGLDRSARETVDEGAAGAHKNPVQRQP